jgi:YYY domain-containing protein
VRESKKLAITSILVAILLLGFYFRFVGIDWGEGQAIHPDEEFLRQVTSAVELPDRLSLYLDTANSPLNPYNRGYNFFVYGTLPLFVTRAVGEALNAGLEPPYSLPARLLSPLLTGRAVEEAWPGVFTASRATGRMVAALFDLGSIILVYLIGRRLGSDWLGLLTAFFYACSFLAIQQAHFYTVDAFVAFFAAAVLFFAIRGAQGGGWGTFALAGVMVGLGLACKISVWPLGVIVALAGLIRAVAQVETASPESTLADRAVEDPKSVDQGVTAGDLSASDVEAGSVDLDEAVPDDDVAAPIDFRSVWRSPYLRAAGMVALAGLLALVVFRIAQPYTFMGPGFFGLRLNERWLANMAEIRRQMSGTVDIYHGHQWANRTPLVFPWINMVFWGMGLPLGLAAWAGWGVAAVFLARNREDVHLKAPLLLVWTWGTIFFFYQGVQWVKSIRYFLPVYSAFVALAAWLVFRLLRWAWDMPWRRVRRWLAIAAVLAVCGGALAWGAASISLYSRSHTRIASSRWIFDNVPTSATVHVETEEGEDTIQLAIPSGMMFTDGVPMVFPFEVQTEGNLVGVSLNHISDPDFDAEPEHLRVAIAVDVAGQDVLAGSTRAIEPPPDQAGIAVTYPLNAPVRLLPGMTYYFLIESIQGGPVQLYTAVLATEHWDWAPPLRVDGHDPFGGMYRGLSSSPGGQLELYHPDTAEKRASLLNWLDEADYIITGSNRLYASIPRLAPRYPLTMAYYERLFSGELGFELVADFVSPPSIGPFQFPDQEEPFAVPEADYQYRPAPISVPMPTAEEAFSVYDHPRVLIFRKTDAYSRERAEALLPASLLDQVVWVTTRDVTPSLRDLFDFGGGGGAEQDDWQEALLDPESWQEQREGGTWSEMFSRDALLNRFQWLGTIVWYLAAALLGVLAFPFLFVALPGLRDRGFGFARAVGLLIVAYLTWLAASLRVLPNTRSTILLVIGTLAALSGFVVWRRWRELLEFFHARRRMLLFQEVLFFLLFAIWLAARLKNPDLWHPIVGGEKPMDFAYLNAVIKSTWFPPYDPWFSGGYLNYYYFGFTLVSTLTKLLGIMPSIAYNLTLPLFYALVGSAAFSVGFNLAGKEDGQSTFLISRYKPYIAGLLALLFVLVLGNLGEVRLLYNGFRMVAGSPSFESTIPGLTGLVEALRGAKMVLIDGVQLPFRTETPYWEPTRMVPFPAFTEFPSFVFLYGDPHANMLALPYTLVAIGVALNWARGGCRLSAGWLMSVLLGALVIGSLFAANSWDYPTYLLIGMLGIVLGTGLTRRNAGSLLWRLALLVGLSFLLFRPYLQNYIAPVSGIETWQDGWRADRIPLDIYILLVGQFLFPLVTVMAIDHWRGLHSIWRDEGRDIVFLLLTVLGGALIAGLLVLWFGVPVGAVAVPVGVFAFILLFYKGVPAEERFVWLLLAMSMGICLAVGFVSIGGDRMNTVAKFYYQVWTCLAVAAAAAVVWAGERLRRLTEEWQTAWWTVMAMLIFAMALFPAMSIPAKLNDRFTAISERTLDGMAYIKHVPFYYDPLGEVDISADYAALVWLQENVEGSPVILEGLGATEYRWGNRVSIYTGLPAVVGWRWHQVQQRMAGNTLETVEQRRLDVSECYSTIDVDRAWEILNRYEVEYVYIGPYEGLYYPAEGLAKFDIMAIRGLLRPVYDEGGVRIYRVLP